MHKSFLTLAAVLGALSVIFGAFGAHAIRSAVSPDAYQVYETAVRYQFYHALALLLLGWMYLQHPKKSLYVSGIFFIAGILLFCGSLYLITYMRYRQIPVTTGVGILTPLGGLCFIIGWISMIVGIRAIRR